MKRSTVLFMCAALAISLTSCTTKLQPPASQATPAPTPIQTATPAPTPEQKKSTASPEADTVLLDTATDSKLESDASMEEYFQTIYDKYHEIDAEAGKYTESDIYAMECFEINDSVSMKLLPSNGLSLYEAWRLGKYPLPSTDQPQTQTQPQPTDQTQPTDQPQTSTPTPTAPPVNDSLPKVTEDKNNDAHIAQQQQQQEQAQQQATASGNFTYPPNSTTADLTPEQIAEGLYVRTDKEGKVYNQEGQFQGFRISDYAERQQVSTDAIDAIYGEDGLGGSNEWDTSNFQ